MPSRKHKQWQKLTNKKPALFLPLKAFALSIPFHLSLMTSNRSNPSTGLVANFLARPKLNLTLASRLWISGQRASGVALERDSLRTHIVVMAVGRPVVDISCVTVGDDECVGKGSHSEGEDEGGLHIVWW